MIPPWWEIRITDADAYAGPCTFCSAPAGQRCVYTTAQPSWNRQLGDPTQIPHAARKQAARRRIHARLWKERHPAVIPATRDRRQAAAAEREFDRREWEQLRDWLRLYGEILWKDARPDGTFRGESYAWADIVPALPESSG
jgi:hypothetical protein